MEIIATYILTDTMNRGFHDASNVSAPGVPNRVIRKWNRPGVCAPNQQKIFPMGVNVNSRLRL